MNRDCNRHNEAAAVLPMRNETFHSVRSAWYGMPKSGAYRHCFARHPLQVGSCPGRVWLPSKYLRCIERLHLPQRLLNELDGDCVALVMQLSPLASARCIPPPGRNQPPLEAAP